MSASERVSFVGSRVRDTVPKANQHTAQEREGIPELNGARMSAFIFTKYEYFSFTGGGVRVCDPEYGRHAIAGKLESKPNEIQRKYSAQKSNEERSCRILGLLSLVRTDTAGDVGNLCTT